MERSSLDEIIGVHSEPLKSTEGLDEIPQFERLAAFMNQDPSYLVFRRFGELNLRNLLLLQYEIGELEQRLKSGPPNRSNVAATLEHQGLVAAVQEKLDRYSQCLLLFHQVAV